MTSTVKLPEGFTMPAGFRFAGVAAGIKPSGKLDVSLIVADRPVVAAGVYTQNQIVAAPVVLSASRTPTASFRAVITNSGNANACTGAQGQRDASTMCQNVAAAVGCELEDVLVMSTGVIGHALPMDRVAAGIAAACDSLGASLESFIDAADAIRTTDIDRKVALQSVSAGDQQYSVAAMAKGAGMIAPNMATMLAVIMTDAPLDPATAQQVLRRVADVSFNRVSVDGHTSTNDTLLLLSSGTGDSLQGSDLESFEATLSELAIGLAKQLVADGEGATHVMAMRVVGAESEQAAEQIARIVSASPLVKTAFTGGDPNWGRIVSAAGYSDQKIEPKHTSLTLCGTTIYRDGAPVAFDAAELSRQMKAAQEVPVELRVGRGPGEAEFWSSDLTTDYVTFNSEYTT